MSTGIIIAIVVVAIIVLVLLFVGVTYNGLVRLRNKVQDQWAQVDVLLKRRTDLIPNLVETVKGYATHEKETLDAVMTARSKMMNATSSQDEMQADGELTKALSRLLAVTEAYPDLKANTNFLELQRDLKETEDKIQYARQFYNDSVLRYKDKLEVFPSNIIAGLFNFKPEAFFQVTEEDKKVPEVKF